MQKRPKRARVLIHDLHTGELVLVHPTTVCSFPVASANPATLARAIPRPGRLWCGTLVHNVDSGQYMYVLAADESWHLAQVDPPLN